MRRREFIALVALTAATWSTVAPTQHSSKPRRIGILMSIPNSDEAQTRITAFRQALQQSGWSDGGGFHIDQRWGAGNDFRIRIYAGELIALNPDVIVVNDPRSLQAVQKITQQIPVVFVATTDPVALGLVATLERPGGNVTGFTTVDEAIVARSVDALAEIAPGLKHVLVLGSSDAAAAPSARGTSETV